MTELTQRSCKPCEGGIKPLGQKEVGTLLAKVSGWQLSEQANEIRRTFDFKNYYETMAFVNALAWIAHQENHHPDIEVSYKKCHVRFSTHAINGLSENDFICAAKINALTRE